MRLSCIIPSSPSFLIVSCDFSLFVTLSSLGPLTSQDLWFTSFFPTSRDSLLQRFRSFTDSYLVTLKLYTSIYRWIYSHYRQVSSMFVGEVLSYMSVGKVPQNDISPFSLHFTVDLSLTYFTSNLFSEIFYIVFIFSYKYRTTLSRSCLLLNDSIISYTS